MSRRRLTQAAIVRSLRAAYHPGTIASLDGHPGMYANVSLQCAAVLVPLLRRGGAWHLLYTRRTETVEHHKGQVSFPGGGCDDSERNPEETALREAREEIGLEPDAVRVLGRLNDVLTITRYRVTPVVGVMPYPYAFKLAPLEVGRAFTIPLSWLADRDHWEEEPFTPDGSPQAFPVITYHPYDGEILWGATARMTLNFLDVLGLLNQ
jgi:8-oxo-dGTP pyrophosphatase MutT (NUDIX family)